MSASEEQTWVELLRLALHLPIELDARLKKQGDLVLIEYIVLAVLASSPDRSRRMTTIAADAHLSPSRLSHLMSRLETRGFVTRQPGTADKRTVMATLTDDGLAVVRRVAPHHLRDIRELVINRLSEGQLAQLRDIARTLTAP